MLGAARTALLALLALTPLLGAEAEGSAGDARPDTGNRSNGDRGAWRSPETWQRLRVGMSQLDVLRILGEPGRITRYYAFERWEYPDALGKRVNFDERGRLLVWGARAR